MNSLIYTCYSNIGRLRKINQDNYICAGSYLRESDEVSEISLKKTTLKNKAILLGVFDGLGGEECGEVASLIAAECASEFKFDDDTEASLKKYCELSNEKICKYADDNNVDTMGTTAALLAFSKKNVVLCNLGDSKIFRLSGGKLEQLSVDHYGQAVFGQKPPLSQCLGIPAAEMIIEPYIKTYNYEDEDIFLICSDGLTDMVDSETIKECLISNPFDKASDMLLKKALDNGGKDNITLILCKTKKSIFWRREH